MSPSGLDSLISPKAQLGVDVQIGSGVHIHDSAVIGDHCVIGDFCIIGHPAGGRWRGAPLVLGPHSTVRSHTVLYEGSTFPHSLETGHHVLIREGTHAGVNLRIGSFSDVEGDCRIGDYNRFHSYVHVGRGSQVGHFVWLYSQTTLTNDPLPPSDCFAPVVLEDGVVACVGTTLLPGAVLRRGAFVAAGSLAKGEVPMGAVVSEGRIIGHVCSLINAASGIGHPWMSHFGHHFPAEAQVRLRSLQEEIEASAASFYPLVRSAGRQKS